ncbi:MAG TPA: PKD domain-containing protein, partial [Candidatus Udaeobacter sp.]|nr:PKD domain-containing protein [Candidatus Udaeobacter sp.]
PYCHDFLPATGPVATACIVPGLLGVSDVNGDGTDNDSGQNTPPDPSVNIRSLSLAEPFTAPSDNQVTFTMQMTPSTTGVVPPSSQWYIIWNRKTLAADGSDRRFVCMKTDATGAESFVYGDFGPPLPLDGSLPPPNANTPTPLGNADFGSFDPTSGVMTIKLADSKLDGSALGAGDHLSALNVRTYLARPDAGQKSQNNASDITVNGDYALVGNASCFCTVDQAPIAGLAASPTQGSAPLPVTFDASSSTDPDVAVGDGVASYTFDFGDGSTPVTQSSPTIQHTYNIASSSSGFFATLTVTDLKCGKASLNTASTNIQVEAGTAATPPAPRVLPRAFRIVPLGNPAHGPMSFALDLVRDGVVNVQLFSPDGRRVADLLDAWMPAGSHTLNWGALDRGGKLVPPGVYLVRARSGDRVSLSRVVLVQ